MDAQRSAGECVEYFRQLCGRFKRACGNFSTPEGQQPQAANLTFTQRVGSHRKFVAAKALIVQVDLTRQVNRFLLQCL